ncbi:MAG: hypothetical protein JW959_02410 [Pirellulales bacterium]|nr:hypothetical protein [Pirellulales bacterium]
MRRIRHIAPSILLLLLSVAAARAEEPRVFDEARSGGGELKYINDLPVLSVSGTPAEIGRQKGILTAAACRQLADYPRRLLERSGRKDRLEQYRKMAAALAEQLPDDHREELREAAKHLGIDPHQGLLANMLPDVYRGGFACSSLIVDGERSKTGGPLFGRNLDFYTLEMLDNYSLVTVHRPKGKHAFVSIGFPGMFGCLSGMNDAGLAVAVHEVFLARDGAPIFNPKGVPYTFAFRRVLEQCKSIAEAEKMLRDTERSTILSLALCDAKDGMVLEMTPKTVVARHSIEGVCACTNHFRSSELAMFALCGRYRRLVHSRAMGRLGLPEMAEKLHQVNLGKLTVQTMVFEPAELKLHLAIGSCPSSALPLKPLELKPLFSP